MTESSGAKSGRVCSRPFYANPFPAVPHSRNRRTAQLAVPQNETGRNPKVPARPFAACCRYEETT